MRIPLTLGEGRVRAAPPKSHFGGKVTAGELDDGGDVLGGANSDDMLKSLLSKGLIQEAGRTDSASYPILYFASPVYLESLELKSVAD